MRKLFEGFPDPLRRLILQRTVISALSLLICIPVVILLQDWEFVIPCVAIAAICGGAAVALYFRCTAKKYIRITGVCAQIEKTVLRHRIKALYIRTADIDIKLVNPKRVRGLSVGSKVALYIADNTPVYEDNGFKVLCNYLTIENVSNTGKLGQKSTL